MYPGFDRPIGNGGGNNSERVTLEESLIICSEAMLPLNRLFRTIHTNHDAPQITTFPLYRLFRTIHTNLDAPQITTFALHAPKYVEVKFADGSVFNLSAEFLRVYSPAADAKVRSIGGEKVISGRRHVGIMSAEPVGNYGVRILFDDLHRTGIYSWDYFYHLGSKKFTLLRNYVKTLKKHGLSRDPPKRK